MPQFLDLPMDLRLLERAASDSVATYMSNPTPCMI
jgi:hypothetical protein